MPRQADDQELLRLLELAQAATPRDRVDFRDPIARRGNAAIVALAPWLTNPVLGAFAVRTIGAAGMLGAADVAISTLREALPYVESAAVSRDILDEVARLITVGCRTTQTTQTPSGATVAGAPRQATQYSPPLSEGEQDLLDSLRFMLPEGWTIFVRPHLDGDRPALALLHRERGAMIWDVRDVDLGGIKGSPKNYLDRDGVPYLDPIQRINAIRQRLYREYLPSWAEAMDADLSLFGAVRAGVYFTCGAREDLERLKLLRPKEVVLGRGGLRSRTIEELVPNANRKVQFDPAWYEVLIRRFSEYHPPTFAAIRPTKRQQELIDDPAAAGWRGLRGVAGSGKSLVLARRATRLGHEGMRVLLVTYNLTLANYCRALLEDSPDRFERGRIVVQHFHGLCHALLRNMNVPPPLHPAGHDDGAGGPSLDAEALDERTQDHFDVKWPDAVRAALKTRGRPAEFGFDAVLIDEAQDFAPSFFDLLAELIHEDAEILLAFDNAQRLYVRAGNMEDRLGDMRRVKRLNGTRRLRQRHANIASALGASRRLTADKIELDDGVPVLFADDDALWAAVSDPAAALAVTVEVLDRWRATDGYRTDGTVVLVPSNAVGQALVRLLRERDIETNHVFHEGVGEEDGRHHKLAFVPHDQRVKVATIHSFKGWEADDVVVVEPPFGGERTAEAMYVALTRAKSRLVVISSSDPYQLRAQFDPIVSEPDETLVARAADLLAEARLPKGRQGPKRGHIPERPAPHSSRMAGQAPADSEPGPDEPDLWGGWGAPS
jgi:hypothetical protein